MAQTSTGARPASPIRDAGGHVAAAPSISGPVTQLRECDVSSLAEDLIEVADRICVGLGLTTATPRQMPESIT